VLEGPGIGVVGVVGFVGVLMGKVISREARAIEGASKPVMIRKVVPSDPGTVENEARHEVARVRSLLGHVWVLCLGEGRGAMFGGVGEGVLVRESCVVCCLGGWDSGVVGVVGVIGSLGPVVLGGWRLSESASLSTLTRLLIVLRTFSMLNVMGWEDASFRVIPRCSSERSAIRDSRQRGVMSKAQAVFLR